MDKEIIDSYITDGKSGIEIAKILEVPVTTLRYWLKKYGITIPNKYKKSSKFWKISKDELIDLVSKSTSIREIITRIGYSGHINSALYKGLYRRLKYENIDYSHIQLGLSSNRNRSIPRVTVDELK